MGPRYGRGDAPRRTAGRNSESITDGPMADRPIGMCFERRLCPFAATQARTLPMQCGDLGSDLMVRDMSHQGPSARFPQVCGFREASAGERWSLLEAHSRGPYRPDAHRRPLTAARRGWRMRDAPSGGHLTATKLWLAQPDPWEGRRCRPALRTHPLVAPGSLGGLPCRDVACQVGARASSDSP